MSAEGKAQLSDQSGMRAGSLSAHSSRASSVGFHAGTEGFSPSLALCGDIFRTQAGGRWLGCFLFWQSPFQILCDTALCRELEHHNPMPSSLEYCIGELSSCFQWGGRMHRSQNRLRKWKRGKWRMRKKKYIHHQGCSVMFFCIHSEFVGMGCSLSAKSHMLCV